MVGVFILVCKASLISKVFLVVTCSHIQCFLKSKVCIPRGEAPFGAADGKSIPFTRFCVPAVLTAQPAPEEQSLHFCIGWDTVGGGLLFFKYGAILFVVVVVVF